MTEIDRAAIVAALAELSEADANAVVAEARSQDRKTKQRRAAEAVKKYVSGTTVTVRSE